MKKQLIIIISLLMALSLIISLSACNINDDEIIEAKPSYDISTSQDLIDMGKLVGDQFSNSVFNLTNDIDMSEVEGFQPIGYRFESAFTGTFKGNGYTISNLNITIINEKDDFMGGVGLFGYVKNATFEDLTLHNINFDFVASEPLNFVGGLYGYGYGKNSVENIQVSGSIKVDNTTTIRISSTSGNEILECTQVVYIGGVVGYNMGEINAAFLESSVTIDTRPPIENDNIPFRDIFIGGAIGLLTGTNNGINNKVNNVNVQTTGFITKANKSYIGSIIGYAKNTLLEDSHAKVDLIEIDGNRSGSRGNIGGAVGYTLHCELNSITIEDTIIRSRNAEIINFGGLVGYADKTHIENSHVKDVYIASNEMAYAGGLVGVLRYSRTMNDSDNPDAGFEPTGFSRIVNSSAIGGFYSNIDIYYDQVTFTPLPVPHRGEPYRYIGTASMVGHIWGDSEIENCYSNFKSVFGIIYEKTVEQGVDKDGNLYENKISTPKIVDCYYTDTSNLAQISSFLGNLEKDELYPEQAKTAVEILDLIQGLFE